MTLEELEPCKAYMRTHALATYPDECVGLIVETGLGRVVFCCRNIAPAPRHAFALHPHDYGAACESGKIVALYHSHCEEAPIPSQFDRTLAEKQKIVVVICGISKRGEDMIASWDIYNPSGWHAPLEGREFLMGVQDCQTLLQDYYQKELRIELPDIPRPAGKWWMHKRDAQGNITECAQDLYREHLPKAGFVPVEKLQTHDLILMQIRAHVPNHCGIYLGDGMMLHHPEGELSGRHPYIHRQGFFAKRTIGYWRHNTLVREPYRENAVRLSL
jgi:proteasome lid subunit RPN8/RPN11